MAVSSITIPINTFFTAAKIYKIPEILGRFRIINYICTQNMERQQVIDNIRQVAARVLPKGSTVYLYGSRARGDWNDQSDWDLLVLLDKPLRDSKDWDNYAWPFTDMGWDIGEDISARTYTKNDWFNGPHSMFYYNVEEDKEVLYES